MGRRVGDGQDFIKNWWTFFVQAPLPKAYEKTSKLFVPLEHCSFTTNTLKTDLSALAKCSISSACSSNKARSSGVGVNFSI